MAQLPTTPPPSGLEAEKIALNAEAEAFNAALASPAALEARGDVESAILLEPKEPGEPPPAVDKSTTSAAVWMAVNTLATIGIVRYPTPYPATNPANITRRRSSRTRPSSQTRR